MKIHNFRVGFATNSSSSHSVVLIPDHLVGQVDGIGADSWGGYGWDGFRLVTEEDKLRYLAAQFFSQMHDDKVNRQWVIDRLAKEVPALAEIDPEDDDLYVDHQSVWAFRASANALEALIAYFKNPALVVLGGNDNDGPEGHFVEGQKNSMLSAVPEEYGDSMIRQDGEYWTVFNRSSGKKLRFSIDDAAPDFVKGSSPELVDLKITNYCAGGCAFCYQSSTIKGQHAPLETIKRYVDLLRDAGVFEIAIGGGEPTDHPDFIEILQYIYSVGMVANFTTFSDRWLDNEELLKVASTAVGGIGVSVHNADGIKLVEKIKAAFEVGRTYDRRPIVSAQHVVGSTFLGETGAVISAAFEKRLPILLLGYKEVGFGKKFQRYDGGEVVLALKLAIEGKATTTVSVDTALVDLYPGFIEAIGAPQALVTSPEGAFSCYIDAVTNRMGPSSYVEPKTMTAVPANVEEFNAVFATY